MKIELGKIANSIGVLDKINSQNPDFKVSYWIMRNIKILTESYNFFINSREEIYSKYCNKIKNDQYPNGTYFKLSPEGNVIFNLKEDVDVENFNKEMQELMSMECDDIQPYILSLDSINNMSNIHIDKNDIFNIDYLLAE